jgi:hypothetical protein
MVREKGTTKLDLGFFPLVKEMLRSFVFPCQFGCFPSNFSDGKYLAVFFLHLGKENFKRESNLKIILLLNINKPITSYYRNNYFPISPKSKGMPVKCLSLDAKS